MSMYAWLGIIGFIGYIWWKGRMEASADEALQLPALCHDDRDWTPLDQLVLDIARHDELARWHAEGRQLFRDAPSPIGTRRADGTSSWRAGARTSRTGTRNCSQNCAPCPERIAFMVPRADEQLSSALELLLPLSTRVLPASTWPRFKIVWPNYALRLSRTIMPSPARDRRSLQEWAPIQKRSCLDTTSYPRLIYPASRLAAIRVNIGSELSA